MTDTLYYFFQSIRWQDAVDILLNSYILYRLYVLLRGTHILRVLVGILCLLYFQKIAATTGLILTSWAIQGITTAAALIIIVVFRNEIRIILQTRNFKTFLFGMPRKPVFSSIKMIAKSAFDMSDRRCGALMVLPGKEDLQEIVHSGIRLNGEVSEEIIKSIFWKDNPVHDGACIIINDHITEVGVILPLSRRKDLPSRFGTRHRAALGVSEQSDALALVVSEETGNVSAAQNGQIQTIRHQAQLEQILKDHTGIEQKRRLNKTRIHLHKIATAALIFLVVSGVWFSITRGLETLITFEVPVKFMNLSTGMEILETPNHKVRLQLSGSEVLIRSLRPDAIDIRIDLSHAVAGLNRFTITGDNISLPPGIKLSNVEQPFVEVKLDETIQKTLYVQADWMGQLKSDLIMEAVRIEPGMVRFTGPSRILSNMSTIYTQPIALTPIEKSGKIVSNLIFDAENLKPEPGGTPHVAVYFIIKQRDLPSASEPAATDLTHEKQ